MAGTNPAMTARRVVLFLAKKQKACYAFVFSGLTRTLEAFRSKMEKKDARDLIF
jgi:hypothetical protein